MRLWCFTPALINWVAAVSFHKLPSGTAVTSLSADGSVAAGTFLGGDAWIWNAVDGLTRIPSSDGIVGNVALSADGKILAGTRGRDNSKNVTAALWKNGRWSDLRGRPRPSSAWGISPDASVVVGLSPVSESSPYPVEGAVWSADGTEAHVLTSSVAKRPTRGNVAANRGQVIGGWQDLLNGGRVGAIWEAQASGKWKQQLLLDQSGHHVGEVLAMNFMGTVIAGEGFEGRGGWIMFRGKSAPTVLANVSEASAVFGVSADGTLAGGSAGQVGTIARTGFLWTPALGVQALLPSLRQLLGDTLPNTTTAHELGAVTAISADGSTIAGWGWALPPASEPGPHGWVAHIRSHSGHLTVEQAPYPENPKQVWAIITLSIFGACIAVLKALVMMSQNSKRHHADGMSEPMLS